MAITASRTTLGMDREVARESASSRGRASLLRKGLRQAKKEKNYEKALQFAAGLEGEGQAYGMTGSADDVSSISRGRVASREALVNQMRSQMPAMAGRSREGNIAAAKSAGTFNATREQFNTANAGKKVMDEAGNISDAPTSSEETPEEMPTNTASTPAETQSREFTPPAAFTAPKMTREEMLAPLPKLPQPTASTVSSAPAKSKAQADTKPAGKMTPEERSKLIKGLVDEALASSGPTVKPPVTKPTSPSPQQLQAEIDSDRRLAMSVPERMLRGVGATVGGIVEAVPKIPSAIGQVATATGEVLSEAASKVGKAAENTGFFGDPEAKRRIEARRLARNNVAARAKGGPVKAGQPYLVGEEGPEIVIPDDDGEVVPNKDLKKKKTRKMLQAALSKK